MSEDKPKSWFKEYEIEKEEWDVEEWEVLDAYHDGVSNETLVEFAFYLPNGEFDEIDVCGFPKEELELWKSRIGKRIKVQRLFDECGDRIIKEIIGEKQE